MEPRPHKDSTLRWYKQRMLAVLQHIQAHLDRPLSLEELATIACLSPHHFHRVFRGMIGEPLMGHVRRLRLERAAYHLKFTHRPVVDLALEAGYDSHEAFCRAFRAHFDRTPTHYRRATNPQPLPSARSGVHFRASGPVQDFRTMNRGVITMNVSIESMQPTRVAYIRHTGPYSGCGQAWDKLCTWMGKEGLLGAGTRYVGVSYDDPEITPPDKIRYDACVTVDDAFQPEGEVSVQVLAGGDYARATHQGPYEKLSTTYHRLMGEWLPRSGRHLRSAPCLEFYLNDPGSTPPAELLTDICVPLELKR